MLSAEIVIKKLSRTAVVSDANYKYFTDNLNRMLTVRSIDFDAYSARWSKHGIFSIVVIDGDTVRSLFTYHGDAVVEFELYLGGNRIWPKQ